MPSGTINVFGGTVLTADPDRPLVERGQVLIEGSTIREVSDAAEPLPADERIDATGMIVSPGFVNAHTHLCMIYGRSLGTDRSLLSWLAEFQVPLMCALEPDDYRLGLTLGAVENLLAGNTTVCEVFFSPHYDREVDSIALSALSTSGIRSVFIRCANDVSFFDGFVESRPQIRERSERLIAEGAGRDRATVGVGPLVPWGSSPDAFRDAVELSREHDVPIHLHTAETPEYNDLVRSQTGMDNVDMLASVGALGERVMLNHCVHLSDKNIAQIAETGTHVIHDPTSNMVLASGVAPVPALRSSGVNIGLACDGPACNNAQDMIEAMKAAVMLQRAVSTEPGALTAADAFAMATRNGARAVGLGDVVGQIRPGFLADIILVDTAQAHMTPMHDALATLVYSARSPDVHTVIVDGRVVVRNRQVLTVEVPRLLSDVQQRASRVRAAAGV
jgi:5-methylthioadenosine/S-adenosylhomocysteine deaminase